MRPLMLLPCLILFTGCTTYTAETRTYDAGNYTIEYECLSTGTVSTSAEIDNGKEKVRVAVKGLYELLIENGNLSLDGKQLGKVKKGDKIKVTRDKTVTVNGEPIGK